MEHLVLGYDGSPASVSALDWTASRCVQTRAKVDVVVVASPRGRDRSHGSQRLGEAAELLRDRVPDIQVEVHRVEGEMPEALAGFVRDVDLVVTGIDPGHPARAAFAGSLPLRLAIDSKAPICMVPSAWDGGDDPVTVGIADDESSDAALLFAGREAQRTSVGIRLVHAWLMPTPAIHSSTAVVIDPDAEIARHRSLLDIAVGQIAQRHPGLVAQSELIRESRSAALVAFAPRASMLVIGSHHRGLLAGSPMGSVVQDILWCAECPVCIVPSDTHGGVL